MIWLAIVAAVVVAIVVVLAALVLFPEIMGLCAFLFASVRVWLGKP